ncbi:hypothetical protein K2Z84_15810 [Candidatus Binatia bacterium]|nr:hypothetical protein [Candidatus Binatia bacterium]
MSDPRQGDVRAAATTDGPRSVLGALVPLVGALRVERALLARRPEVGAARPAFSDQELDHWRALLDGSPTLGTLVDATYEEARAGVARAVTTAHRVLATATLLAGLLVVTIALPAIGQMFDVSPWLLIAIAYAGLAQVGALRAARLGHGAVHVGLDALDEPIARARNAHGEQASGVLLVEARARRASATASNRALADALDAMNDAASASLRNALLAIAVWLLLNAVPQSIAATFRGLTSGFGG